VKKCDTDYYQVKVHMTYMQYARETQLSRRHCWSSLEVEVGAVVREVRCVRRNQRAAAHVRSRRLNSKQICKSMTVAISSPRTITTVLTHVAKGRPPVTDPVRLYRGHREKRTIVRIPVQPEPRCNSTFVFTFNVPYVGGKITPI